jgi:hypothetical protein
MKVFKRYRPLYIDDDVQDRSSVRSNFVLCIPAHPVTVSCAALLPSSWCGTTALQQCVVCINGLTVSCWFDNVQPS